MVDSGSAITCIATEYDPTSTSVNTDKAMMTEYKDGDIFTGMTYKDIISCHIHTYVRNFVH